MARKDIYSTFDKLLTDRAWIYDVGDNLVGATDPLHLARVQRELDSALEVITPSDFKQWLSSDVFHAWQTLEHESRAVRALGLSNLSDSVRRWSVKLCESMNLLAIDRSYWFLCCGTGAVEDREISADAFVTAFQEMIAAGDPQNATTRVR